MTDSIVSAQVARNLYQEYDYAEEYDILVHDFNEAVLKEAGLGNKSASIALDCSDKTIENFVKDTKSAGYDVELELFDSLIFGTSRLNIRW